MHNYSTRLFDTPFYRDTARGALDPTIQYSVNKAREYHTKAPQIREMRFAKSSAFDADFAIRNQREQDISNMYSSGADPSEMQGIHARMTLQGTQSGGALAPFLGGAKVKLLDNDGYVRSSNLGFDTHPISKSPVARSVTYSPAWAKYPLSVSSAGSGFASTGGPSSSSPSPSAKSRRSLTFGGGGTTFLAPTPLPTTTTSGRPRSTSDPATPSLTIPPGAGAGAGGAGAGGGAGGKNYKEYAEKISKIEAEIVALQGKIIAGTTSPLKPASWKKTITVKKNRIRQYRKALSEGRTIEKVIQMENAAKKLK